MAVRDPSVDTDPRPGHRNASTQTGRPARLVPALHGVSPATERVRRLARQAASTLLPVLVEGEPGTGKEALARAIHAAGPRRGQPFHVVHCADFDAERFEATFLAAAGRGACGTLFLGAVGELPHAAQASLECLLARGSASDRADRGYLCGGWRLVAASNRRLVDLVSAGRFNPRLFNHLNLLPIWLAPLRDRRQDIVPLAEAILARASEATRRPPARISDATLAPLLARDWPGNVRELERALLQAVMLCDGGELMPQDLGANASDDAALSAATPCLHAAPDHEHLHHPPPPPQGLIADKQQAPRYGVARLLDEGGEMRPIEALEEEVIRFAIGHYRGHMSEVARRLGIGRSTLYRKIKDYGIAMEPVPS